MAVQDDPDLPFYKVIMVYLCYLVIVTFSYAGEYIDYYIFRTWRKNQERNIAPFLSSWESFYTRRVFKRLADCWNRPVGGVASAWIDLEERVSDDYCATFRNTGKIQKCLNMGSYNYLGFSSTSGPILEAVQATIEKYGISTCSPSLEAGQTDLHREIEVKMAEFLGKEDCVVFGMGYMTNASTIPAFVGKGCLVLSDSLNHASLVSGCRSSGAKIKTFEHNDPKDLEEVVRRSIVEGQPRTHRPWKKILIIVEGIYSMEGEICPLKAIVEVKKKYKCYLWVDEAHSIGAVGPTGRGVCDHAGVDTKDVDVLMGTFTKSYAAVGGYITGTKEMIAYLRATNFSSIYTTSMAPGACQQIISSLSVISGEDGTDDGKKRLRAIRENSNYFRNELIARGFQIIGDENSPVIPLMLYYPTKIGLFSRECLKRGVATVVVGFPAVPLLMGRTRFCISASHTKEDLDFALKVIDEVGDVLDCKYGMIKKDEPKKLEDAKKHA